MTTQTRVVPIDFDVTTRSGAKRRVAGLARTSWNGLAIYQVSRGKWTITQASSGLAVMLDLPRQDAAIACADELAPMADWTRDPLELTKDRAFLDTVIPATREMRQLYGGRIGGSRKRRVPVETYNVDDVVDDGGFE